MKEDGTGEAQASPRVKLPWGAAMLVLLLTLAVWVFFYVEDLPLDAASTSVVALAMTLAVFLGRRAWRRPRGGAAK